MASKKNPSIFSTLQKTTANASAVNGEFTHQIPLDALEDNPLNRFSMAEDEEFLSTMHSMEKDGLLEDIIVTPSDTEGRYRIISGHRRVHLAVNVRWAVTGKSKLYAVSPLYQPSKIYPAFVGFVGVATVLP